MKIHLDSGERVEIVVPARLHSSAAVAIVDSEGQAMLDVEMVDGFLLDVAERSVRRYAKIEDRLDLWGHLVSAHAAIIPLQATLKELVSLHEHEHDGPGTIRNHPRESRAYSLNKIGKVLSEAEDHDAPTVPTEHAYLASYSSGREVGCHLCHRPRSDHKE